VKRIMSGDDRKLETKVQEALRTSELSYRRLFEAAQDGILILDVQTGRINDVNPFLADLLGYTRDEMVGKTVGELSPFQDIASNHAMLTQLQTSGYVRYEDLPLKTRDGCDIAVEFVSNVYEAGAKKVIQCNVRDITARKKSADALHEFATNQACILDALPAHVALINRDGVILSVNEAWRKFAAANALTGTDYGVGQSYLHICQRAMGIGAEMARETAIGMQEVLNGDSRLFTIEYPCHSPDQQRWFLLRIVPVGENAPNGAVVMHVDITERKISEESLRSSQRNMAAAQQSAHIGSWEIGITSSRDVVDEPVQCSDEVFRIAGFEPGAIEASKDLFSKLIPADDRQRVENVMARAIASRQPYSVVHKLTRPNGEERVVEEVVQVVLDEKTGEPVRLIGTTQDITERMEAKKQLLWKTAFFEAQVHSALDGILIVDGEGKIILQNQRMLDLWKIPVDFANHGDDRAQREWASQQTADPHEFRKRVDYLNAHPDEIGRDEIKFLDGRCFDRYSAPVIGADGTYYGRIWSFRDVTERKQSELANVRLGAIVEFSDDAIIGKDLQSVITSWNRGAEKIFGYTSHEMVGSSITRLIPADRQQEENFILSKIVSGTSVEHFETLRQTKDGRLIDVSITASPIKDATGRSVGVSKVARDITARRLTEKALHLERDFISAVVDTVGYLVVVLDRQACIVRFNRECERLTGYSFDEARGQNLIDLVIMPAEKASTKQEFESLRAGHFPNTFENHWVTKGGDPRTIEWSNTALLDAHGAVEFVIGTGVDITQRRRDEAALRASRATMDSAFASMSDAVFITDRDGRFLEFNDAFVSIHRYKNRADCGRKLSEYSDTLDIFFPNGDPAPIETWAVSRALSGETVANAEFLLRRKDTGETWVGSYSFSPIRDVDGLIIGSVTVGRDITERKRNAEQIAEQAALLDKTRDAILVRDLHGKILFWNKGAEVTYGWQQQEVLGRNVKEFIYADPGIFENINGLTLSKGSWSGEVQHLTKDRNQIIIEARWTLICDDEGRPKSVLSINTDITEKKRIEAQYMRAQRMESIGTLAGGVAHDLNNILSPILMSIDLLKGLSTNPQAKDILDTIEVSAQRGADIVRQVLSFARGMEGQRIEVQPRHLINDLKSIIKDTFPKDIRLQFNLPTDTWTVLGDPTQIHQVLLNLCVNARDAMPNGGSLTIGLENCALDEHYAAMNMQVEPGRYVIASVSDSGTGIPKNIVDKIFDPFFTKRISAKVRAWDSQPSWLSSRVMEGWLMYIANPARVRSSGCIFLPRRLLRKLKRSARRYPVYPEVMAKRFSWLTMKAPFLRSRAKLCWLTATKSRWC
jgi:PAS domain S-box-containing protein